MNGDDQNQSSSEPNINYGEPVAYDANGRPLYAAPPSSVPPEHYQQQIVHVTRALEPVDVEVSPELKAKHERSKSDFPNLNLSEHEYIVSAVSRHPLGLLMPVSITILMVSIILFFMLYYPHMATSMGLDVFSTYPLVIIMCVLLVILFLIGGYIAIFVYQNNRFFLTNESVIQEIQNSVFSKKEQTVSLANIEDASYSQHGILQSIFDYGSIRLSTEGDETTYRFDYVSNPKRQIGILNNAVEAFKNGRPVEEN